MTSRPHDQPTASCPGSSDGSQVIPDLFLPNELRVGRLRGLLGSLSEVTPFASVGLVTAAGSIAPGWCRSPRGGQAAGESDVAA